MNNLQENSDTGLVNGAQIGPRAPVTAVELVRMERAQALAIVATMAPQDLALSLKDLRKPGEIAELVTLVPTEKLRPVLAQDPRVFERARDYLDAPDAYDNPQGPVLAITLSEYRRLFAEGHGRWLVPTTWSDLGEPISWGVRSTLTNFHAVEAYDRLKAILESENDNDWMLAALKALSHPYIVLSLKYLIDQEHRLEMETLLDKVKAVMAKDFDGDDFVAELEDLFDADTNTLLVRLHEEREQILAETAVVITLTPEAAEVVQRMAERPSAQALLDQIRAGKMRP